jgi:hypothetical protein
MYPSLNKNVNRSLDARIDSAVLVNPWVSRFGGQLGLNVAIRTNGNATEKNTGRKSDPHL